MDVQIAKYLQQNKVLQAEDVVKFYPEEDATELSTRVKKIKQYRKQLKKLLEVPLIKQKSPEWYEMRKGLITASDFAQALGMGKFGTQKQLIEKKCVTKDEPMKSNPFFDWGNMFEQVASDIYSDMYSVKMYEFGLIPHPKLNFFGASPDGISNLGIMLEIKCPLKRKITGEIPLQYYYQIQGQLDVCGLDECDYIECEFQRWENYDDYALHYNEGWYTGCITVHQVGEEKTMRYSKVGKTKLPQQPCLPGEKVYYWMLVNHQVQRVYKDEVFLAEKLGELKKVWDRILHYRAHPLDFAKDIKQSMVLDTQTLEDTSDEAKVELKGFRIVHLEE